MWHSVVESLLPVLLMIMLGTGLRTFGFMPDLFFNGLNKLAFWIGLPCLLFLEISAAHPQGSEPLRIAAAVICVSLILGITAWGVAAIFRLPTPSLRVFVQGAFRGNLAYVGIPVICYALSANPEARAIAILALAPTIPAFNIACVLLLIQPQSGHRFKRVMQTLQGIGRNPLIIACVLGMIARYQSLILPTSLHRTIEGVGRIGLPAALMALGASLSLERVKGRVLVACVAATMKVALGPILGYVVGRAFGLVDDMLLVAVLYAAMPTAVASFVMADQMGADKELAAAIIVTSTVLAFPALALVLLYAS